MQVVWYNRDSDFTCNKKETYENKRGRAACPALKIQG